MPVRRIIFEELGDCVVFLVAIFASFWRLIGSVFVVVNRSGSIYLVGLMKESGWGLSSLRSDFLVFYDEFSFI